MYRLLLLLLLPVLVVAELAYGEEAGKPTNDQSLIAMHQRCVLLAFAQYSRSAREFDPNLLNNSIDYCEAMLEPLRASIEARTRDPQFTENILAKIRQASRRGVAVAVTGYFAGETK
ncbi:MAG: hypothetical protein K2Y27_14435 [Xanthobacteraceae bacterium]|nr:hypothetical protein [Xanthobacteraceae bacterium]